MTKDTEIEVAKETRGRTPRKKVYERVRQAQVPDDVKELFWNKGYDLKWVRWAVDGVEQLRYLDTRLTDGYEFVDAKELPDHFLRRLRLMDARSRNGLVTNGDLCLMKIDSELRQSRRDYFSREADADVDAVNIHVLEKKGFKNLGTRSKVIMREPTFSD